MNGAKILIPAIASTTIMTLFSQLVAELENENFNESELLACIEKKALPQA